ncbi:unnamed protein product [Arctogadus glacialis]
MRDNMTDDSADSLNDVVTQFTSYEDFLDSKITASALYYLEDEELARQLVELGQWGTVLTREEFQSRKVSPSLRNQHRTLASAGKELKDNFLKALAEREENNRNGILTSIIFIRDRNAGVQEVSGYIDYAHRLQTEDFEAYFSGKKRLMPRRSDLSFYNWRTQMSTSHSSPNYEVITDQPSGLVFQNKTDRKVLELNPWAASSDNWCRSEVKSDLYVQVVIYDHKTRSTTLTPYPAQ